MRMKPIMCGGKPFSFPIPCSTSIRFEGAEQKTIHQGDVMDLCSGVVAYSEDGMPIPFKVTPCRIDSNILGRHEVVYEAGRTVYKRYITVIKDSAEAVVCNAIVCESVVVCEEE